jgi:hypothetical protein
MTVTKISLLILLTPPAAVAEEAVCEVASPAAAFSIPRVAQAPELNTDTHSATWSHAASAWIKKDCTHLPMTQEKKPSPPNYLDLT